MSLRRFLSRIHAALRFWFYHRRMTERGYVYILRLKRPIGNHKHEARFYVGCTYDLLRRLEEHRKGYGAAMLRFCNDVGVEYELVHVERGYRERELKIKNRKNNAKYLATRPKQKRPYGLHNWYTKLFSYLATCAEVSIVGNCVYFEGISAFFTKRAMIAIRRGIRIRAGALQAIAKREAKILSLG